MTNPHAQAVAALKALERNQIEQYRPRAQEERQSPQTPEARQRAQAQAYLDRLNASCSSSISVDAGWLR
jgi:hypothetical protein